MSTKDIKHPVNNRNPIREGNTKGNQNQAPKSPRPSDPPPSQSGQQSRNNQTGQSGNTSKNDC
jgi:hypothetical protein